MSLILCAAFMQVALLSAQPEASVKPEVAAKTEAPTKAEADAVETYTEAHRVTAETGKPLVVMVGADWCGPCQNMRRAILPRVREHGLFRKVAFAHVNLDREKDIANEITGGGPVPQLVMFRKTKDGWQRRKLIGGHSVEEVEKFINEGLAVDADKQKVESKNVSHEVPAPQHTTSNDTADDEKQHG
jgi:thioredoxin-like negative regulator of GroEL